MNLNRIILAIAVLLPFVSCSQKIVTMHSIPYDRITAFDSTYDISHLVELAEDRYTPKKEDIEIAEELLFFFGRDQDLLKCGYRQYVGYIYRGQRYLLVNMLRSKCNKPIEKIFQNWKKEYIVIFTEPDEPVSLSYTINLEEKMIGH